MTDSDAEGAKPEVGVGAVVITQGHLLLVTRNNPPAQGRWTVPGGRLERGESLRQAVEREVLEETALEVEAGDLVGWVERMGAGFHFVILDFFASLIGQAKREAVAGRLPTLVAGDDAGEARWVPLDQIETMPLVNGLADFLTEHGVLPAASG